MLVLVAKELAKVALLSVMTISQIEDAWRRFDRGVF